ncbi:MAG: hypothetical protein ACLVCH_06900 [Roseburia inulinivorans]
MQTKRKEPVYEHLKRAVDFSMNHLGVHWNARQDFMPTGMIV